MGVLSEFSTRVSFPRIAPVTWANDAPLETVANRLVPMGCGPNMDQVGLHGVPGLVQPRTPPALWSHDLSCLRPGLAGRYSA
jgi:hypothetical protein